MDGVSKAEAGVLFVGDTLMLKQNGKVCYGTIKEIINQTESKTFMILNDLVYENGKQEDNPYVIINNEDLYHVSSINESAEVLDGTEPFSNGIFMVNVPDADIIKRNRRVDEYTEKLLSKAKDVIDEPMKINVIEDKDDQTTDTEPDKKGSFKPVAIKKK